ncbi:uncharacterized protein Z519_00194 [Cladophialophora bantiana CBS 173.52]|uniref:Uncharacterized protein n=1 Tax=Cladophialophora bantiana (strain ATCC 10958 / CBS 173.52 / CDC B-1940 / NIH 8579) TaxID=1442370 RepID=A0A0D2HYM7_CLAB1|nr:uncharacterized protein Z519_00194 [Cladophialophora bantiana CBS 173.52]KIW98533.1 hypothetical protein Z519_00194 [Cladophialophora bantiana CBS 173.52]
MESLDGSKRQGHIKITDAGNSTSPSEKASEPLPTPPGLKSYLLNAVERYWLFEFFGWALACGCLVGTIALLAVHNGREAPTWTLTVGSSQYRKTFGLTINTIISVFATAFNSGLLIPVAASISQLKWIWFQKGRRPLAHFQKFESAARGPLGSLILLWTLRCRRLACLGAIIVIAALGTGFSFQALVVYPLQPVQVDVARIQRTNLNWGSNSLTTSLSNDMVGAIYSGIYQYTDVSQMKNVSCSTGNCTWLETYTSMAVCSECHDVTASLKKTCGTAQVSSQADGVQSVVNMSLPYCNYSLPNGLKASGVPSVNYSSLEISSSTADSVHFDADSALSVLSTIWTQWGSGVADWGNLGSLTPASDIMGIASTQAIECAIYYCVQKFNASVSRGKLSERVIDTYAKGRFTSPDVYVLEPPASFTNHSNKGYANVYQSNQLGAIRDFFSTQWAGQVLEFGTPPTNTPTTPIAQFLWGIFFEQSPFAQFLQMFSSLAKSMSDNIRSYSIGSDAVPTADGATYQDKPHVKVRWGWLALPAALLGLALTLLVGTIAATAHEKTLLWKGSGLAAFSHPLTSDARAVVSDVRSPREVLMIAEQMDVKWEKTDRGFRLVR